jgi:hypothetical protein
MWIDGPVEGDYERICAPEDWREIIAEADRCTHGCTPGQTEPGDEDDWEWYQWTVLDHEGYITGAEWIVARYIG